MLVLAALVIDSRVGHNRIRKTSLRCRGLHIKGYFYKATAIYKVSYNFSQIEANFAFAACSVNSDKMNAEKHSTGSNAARPQVWVSGQVWWDARLSELTHSSTASGIKRRHM